MIPPKEKMHDFEATEEGRLVLLKTDHREMKFVLLEREGTSPIFVLISNPKDHNALPLQGQILGFGLNLHHVLSHQDLLLQGAEGLRQEDKKY